MYQVWSPPILRIRVVLGMLPRESDQLARLERLDRLFLRVSAGGGLFVWSLVCAHVRWHARVDTDSGSVTGQS